MRVLILDAGQRAALAVTRSLGAAGYGIVTADEMPRTLADASRFSAGSLTYPSPYSDPDAFIAWTSDTLKDKAFDAVVPITEVTTDILVRHRDQWPDVTLPFAPIDTIDRLSDKVSLYRRALELNVSVPRSVVVTSREDVARAVDTIGFPAILKPGRSRVRQENGFISTSVRRADNPAELESLLEREEFRDHPFLYQERVGGRGQGIFALYDRGRVVAWFAHKRLKEKPPEGGVSVLCESCPADPGLLALAKRLLDDAHWHGVAMVEFKVEPDGRPHLMEVNARFWGSLQLAIDSGVDFPRLLLEHEGASETGVESRYRQGRRLRWFLGDLDRLYLLTSRASLYGPRRIAREWLSFVVPRPRTRHETFRWTDPRPAFRELADYVAATLRSTKGN